MKDFVIKGNGNSRYLKSSLEGITTWEQFRVALAAGTLPVDLNGINPEGFQQLGDPLNKATLLKDVTASILGLPNTAVPDDAFLALTIGVGTYGYRVKIQLADGTPVEGATVSGITALTGSTLVSGADGIVLGKSTSQTVTIGCTSPYIDQAAPANQSVTATGTITDVTLTLTSITDMITVTSSKTTKVSPMAKTMDVTAVGGGGGGGGYNQNSRYDGAGAGGGGGYVSTKIGVECADKLLKIALGGRGSGSNYADGNVSAGGSGGDTSLQIDGVSALTANGGKGGAGGSSGPTAGGSGNGSGGNGGRYENVAQPGGSGSGYIFNDSRLGLAGGGGGGGGFSGNNATDATAKSGGLPYGGKGGTQEGTYSGTSGSGPGGGGGGAGSTNGNGGAGSSGQMYLRFHF
uniref:Glycine-rich domain-containing protein n=1 Tax=Siphoviridae sp. ctepM7 TaxID=2826408 RepID=A0A8S5N9F6_9CAUD|nr:MAG TPA: hypothetical protein [Siphoviridae sp. ctepM7]